MKRFQLILILVCLAIVSSLIIYFVTKYPKAHETEEMVVPSMVIDGLFFTERPEPLPENSRAGYFKEPDGNRISVIETANGNALSDWSKKLAIPKERVRNADSILALLPTLKYYRTSMKLGKIGVSAGEMMPQFSEKDTTGRVWSSKDIEGKVALFNFWNLRCGPCIAEMPELEEWRKEFPQILFFSVSTHPKEKIRGIVKRRDFNFIHLVDADSLGKITSLYPVTILVDANGIIDMAEIGTTPRQRYLLHRRLSELSKR